MKKIIFILMICFTNAYAYVAYNVPNGAFPLTAQDMGVPDYMNAFRQGMAGSREAAETAYTSRMLAENLRTQQLQNQMMQMQLNNYLTTHPKIAKDLRDQDELQIIINRNSGLFSKKSALINDLKICANHRNGYCRSKLDEELIQCKKKHRC